MSTTRIHALRWLHGGVLALAAFGASADAAIIDVKPGASVQAALTVAQAGDTIRIFPGTYGENVTILSGKDGLVLKGMGKKPDQVVIDARPSAPNPSGPGIRVLSAGVQIKNLVVRHARATLSDSGHGIEVAADGVVLDKVVVERSQQDGVFVVGNGFVAKNCTFLGNAQRGVTLAGEAASFTSCVFGQSKDGGVQITGTLATLKKCVVHSIKEGEGIEIIGAGALLQKCKVRGAYAESIKINGADATVQQCEVTNGGDDGIRVTGSNFRIEKNKISGLLFEGDGIRIATATGGLVQKNDVRDTAESALKGTALSGVAMVANSFTNCGTDKKPVITISSNSVLCLIQDNVVKLGQGDGIRVDGDDNQVFDNVVSDCLEDGIDVSGGSDNKVEDNVISRCHGEGIENNGSDTDCEENVMTQNRVDLASDGSFDNFDGNEYVTGGPGFAPQIDD